MDLDLASLERDDQPASADDIHRRAEAMAGPLALALDDTAGAVYFLERQRTRLLGRRRPPTRGDLDALLLGDSVGSALADGEARPSRLGRFLRERRLIPVRPEPAPLIATGSTDSDPCSQGEVCDPSSVSDGWSAPDDDRTPTRGATQGRSDEPTVGLEAAIAALPVRQRTALVATRALGWPTAQAARALGTEEATVELRVRRAVGELTRTTARSFVDIDRGLADALLTLAGRADLALVPDAEAEGRARRMARRNRLLIAAGSLVAVAVLAAVVVSSPSTETGVDDGPPTADPPRASQPPHAPIADGRGGFLALNRAGGRIVASSDGITWSNRARLNVNRLDLRLFVERFTPTEDGRYMVLIESSSGGGMAIDGSDQPRVAVSSSLTRWAIHDVVIEDLPELTGLRPTIDLLDAAAVGDRVLAIVGIDYAIDYVAHRIDLADVCATADDLDGIRVQLCSGETISIADGATRRAAGLSRPTRLLAGDANGPMTEIPTGEDFGRGSIFGLGDGFGMIDAATSAVLTSADGERWEPLFDLDTENRLGLVASRSDAVVVVSPSRTGWESHRLADGQVVSSAMPVTLDPTTVWLKPELVAGPAGWALFVTTSRPWERQGNSPTAWAVHVGDWVVERRPNEGLVATATEGTAQYHFRKIADLEGEPIEHPLVEWTSGGGVRLTRPGTDRELVEVTGQQIRESWVTGAGLPPASAESPGSDNDTEDPPAKAFVLWSPDGVVWTEVWRTDRDTWYGSVAVGDDEVLVSAAGVSADPTRVEVRTDG